MMLISPFAHSRPSEAEMDKRDAERKARVDAMSGRAERAPAEFKGDAAEAYCAQYRKTRRLVKIAMHRKKEREREEAENPSPPRWRYPGNGRAIPHASELFHSDYL